MAMLKSGDVRNVLEFMSSIDQVLGVIGPTQEASVEEEIQDLIRQRQEARASKRFDVADGIRDQLAARGIQLIDTPIIAAKV